jgi:hypothetical protein
LKGNGDDCCAIIGILKPREPMMAYEPMSLDDQSSVVSGEFEILTLCIAVATAGLFLTAVASIWPDIAAQITAALAG